MSEDLGSSRATPVRASANHKDDEKNNVDYQYNLSCLHTIRAEKHEALGGGGGLGNMISSPWW